ncbi:hypothetical protein [Tepidibacillus fermentans]|uniref:Uncharacterized protein n=1 Tax=Tepidibacillus fermentans TaxID=1281767 RepID=A0A4R3KG50_9BACI|nr:hypothetical protein [Tepidibacillus fermentans]TCS82073.1 hypothetical protein EDD72_1106 [Tepidibacillus fermentans]
MAWIIPLIASIISFLLTWSLVKQYIERKKIHQLLYSLSLSMFTLAAFGEFYSEWKGFNHFIYKLYYFPAITLVPVMAAGTLYLLLRKNRWIAHLFLLYTVVLSIWMFVLLIPVIPDEKILGQTIAIGGEGMPDYIRRFSFPLSGIGGIVLILGALISWWKTRFKGNLYIAAGAIVMSLGGKLATMGLTTWLPLSELLGILLLYYGVVIHPSSKKNEIKSY